MLPVRLWPRRFRLMLAQAARRLRPPRHDEVTCLLNRRGMRDKLKSFARGSPMLLCLGLEWLKPVDDLFGRDGVNELLVEAAARLGARLQDGDILARAGGDEFMILRAESLGRDAAIAYARAMINCLSQPFTLKGGKAQISACAGLARGYGHGETAEGLLDAVHIALGQARAAGAGQVRLFTEVMNERLSRPPQWEEEFQAALRDRDFLLLFQPIFACQSLTLCGFEALARWRHPGRGMIGPEEFIPIAEAGDMIGAFGTYMLEAACRAASAWPGALRVAVNLSPVQLRDPALPERVREILDKTGLASGRLELELTEGTMLEPTRQTQASLAALKAIGVSLAIDDFGIGYSSLSYLHRFSFQRLKIDKSFVEDAAWCGDAGIVIRAIIGLCAALGMESLAEGVETREQLEFLREAGCNEVQGYLLGHPLAEEEIPALLARLGGGPLILP